VTTGFRFDGISEDAGNIPTGKPGQPLNILTVNSLLKMYKEEAMSQTGKLISDKSDLLSSAVMIYHNNEGELIFSEFLKEREKFELENAVNCKHIVEKRLRTFFKDMEKYSFKPKFTSFGPPENFDVKVKTDIFRFPTLLATDIGNLLRLPSRYSWKKYADMVKQNILSLSHCFFLRLLLALSIYIRLNSYMHSRSKSDLVSLYKCCSTEKTGRYHIPQNIFIALGCLLLPIKTLIQQFAKTALESRRRGFEINRTLGTELQTVFHRAVAEIKSQNTTNCWIKIEVIFFTGDHSLAMEQICNTVGKDSVYTSCEAFLRAKNSQTANPSSDKKCVEISCYLLLSNGLHELALNYLKWLEDHSLTDLDRMQWKILLSDSLNRIFHHKQSMEQLLEVFRTTNNTFHEKIVSDAKGNFSQTNTNKTSKRKLLEIVSHAYKILADTCRHLKYFAQSEALVSYSVKLIEQMKTADENFELEIVCHNSLASVYYEQQKYEQAHEQQSFCLEKLISRHGKHASHPDLSRCYRNMAKILCSMWKYEESLNYCEMSQAVFLKKV